jgi:hypothetical protein
MRRTRCLRAASYKVVHADDVGLQDRLERPFDRHAAEVHHSIDAVEQRVHRGGVFERRGSRFFARRGRAQVGAVADAQHRALRLQARAQNAPEGAGRAGQQQAIEQRGRGGGGWHAGRSG